MTAQNNTIQLAELATINAAYPTPAEIAFVATHVHQLPPRYRLLARAWLDMHQQAPGVSRGCAA